MSTPYLIGASKTEVIARMEADFNFCAQVLMPETFTLPFPNEYLAMAALIADSTYNLKREDQYGFGLPRGFAKTTLLKVLIARSVLFSPCKYFMAVGSSQPKAENIIADVEALLSSPNCVNLFGPLLAGAERNRSNLKVFTVRNKQIILQAVGAHGDPRGSNLKFLRPDFILMDDIQSRECALSKVESEKLSGWMLNTLLHAKAAYGCVSVYIGNKYNSDFCILSALEDNKDWKTLVTGAILADMRPLWPELKPIETILRDMARAIRSGNFAGFAAEILNDAKVRALDTFREDKLLKWKYASHELPQAQFIIIDPSGESEESDDTGICHVVAYDGVPWVKSYLLGKMSPLQTIVAAIKLGISLDCPHIFVESVAYQKSLLFWFNFIVKRYGITGFTILPCNPHGASKNSRIISFLRSTQSGEIGIHPDAMPDFIMQTFKFDPARKKNKDEALDLGAYALEIYTANSDMLTQASMAGSNILHSLQGANVQHLTSEHSP